MRMERLMREGPYEELPEEFHVAREIAERVGASGAVREVLEWIELDEVVRRDRIFDEFSVLWELWERAEKVLAPFLVEFGLEISERVAGCRRREAVTR